MKRILENEDCANCGDSVMVDTMADKGYAYDGDNVNCVSCELTGMIIVDNGRYYIDWDEEKIENGKNKQN